jgi:hypothetical protein
MRKAFATKLQSIHRGGDPNAIFHFHIGTMLTTGLNLAIKLLNLTA